MSKLLEKAVEHRLKDHLNLNNLHDINQSAYRSNHSTGTSADKLLCCSVLQGSVLGPKLYCMYTKHVHQACTPIMYTKHVHQACTPSMYTKHVHQACTPSMYTKPIGDIVKRHRFNYHCYADDTYMYFSIKPGENWGDVSAAIGAFVADVGAFMTRNMLT